MFYNAMGCTTNSFAWIANGCRLASVSKESVGVDAVQLIITLADVC